MVISQLMGENGGFFPVGARGPLNNQPPYNTPYIYWVYYWVYIPLKRAPLGEVQRLRGPHIPRGPQPAMKGPSLSCHVTFVQLLLQRSSDHESPQAANKTWCDSVTSKWMYGHPIWMNDSFLLWKLGWANMFDGHWNQQNVPLRGKKNITGDPTQHIIIPKPFFEGPASLPSYCSLATCSWHFGLLIIEFMFQGGWYVISNDPFFSQFCSLRGFFPLNSWHQKNPVIIHQFVFVRPTASL